MGWPSYPQMFIFSNEDSHQFLEFVGGRVAWWSTMTRPNQDCRCVCWILLIICQNSLSSSWIILILDISRYVWNRLPSAHRLRVTQGDQYLDNINVGNLAGTLWYIHNEARDESKQPVCVCAHKQHQAWRNCSASFARWCLSDHESSTSPSSSGTRASAVSSGITSKSIVCVLVWVIMSVVIICWIFLVCNIALSSCVLKSDLFIRLDSASLGLVCILDMDRLVEATRQLICHLVSQTESKTSTTRC